VYNLYEQYSHIRHIISLNANWRVIMARQCQGYGINQQGKCHQTPTQTVCIILSTDRQTDRQTKKHDRIQWSCRE